MGDGDFHPENGRWNAEQPLVPGNVETLVLSDVEAFVLSGVEAFVPGDFAA